MRAMAVNLKMTHIPKYVLNRYRYIAIALVSVCLLFCFREYQHRLVRREAEAVLATAERQFHLLKKISGNLEAVQGAFYHNNALLLLIQTSADGETRLKAIEAFQASQVQLDSVARALQRAMVAWEQAGERP